MQYVSVRTYHSKIEYTYGTLRILEPYCRLLYMIGQFLIPSLWTMSKRLNILFTNFKKSCCIRIGHRMDAPCATISSSTSGTLPWVKELRYLGVHILQSRTSGNVHCQTTEKHFIARQMLYLERLVASHQRM